MIYQGVSINVESPIAGWLISWKERYFTFDWVIYLPFTSINAIYFKPPKRGPKFCFGPPRPSDSSPSRFAVVFIPSTSVPTWGIFDGYINGHFRILNWRYLPYIRPSFQAYVRAMFQGISPQNMAKNMVLTYLQFRILEFPLSI